MDSSILPFITGGSGALVVLAFLAWAFFSGRLHSDREFNKLEAGYSQLKAENDRLQEALQMERRTADEVTQAAQVTNKLIAALTVLATERRALPAGDITAKDLGL